jgi:hypothetical protein
MLCGFIVATVVVEEGSARGSDILQRLGAELGPDGRACLDGRDGDGVARRRGVLFVLDRRRLAAVLWFGFAEHGGQVGR